MPRPGAQRGRETPTVTLRCNRLTNLWGRKWTVCLSKTITRYRWAIAGKDFLCYTEYVAWSRKATLESSRARAVHFGSEKGKQQKTPNLHEGEL